MPPNRPPRVLVAFASRHESTAEIAAAIARELETAGCAVTVAHARNVEPSLAVTDDAVPRPRGGEPGGVRAPWDGAVIGSALYLGRWDDAALELLRREQAALAAMPTWLFSSGPVGEGTATAHPERLRQPADVAAIATAIGARTTTFGGRVDAGSDTLEARIMASAGMTGDWRDFARIRSWARTIALELASRAAPDEMAEPA